MRGDEVSRTGSSDSEGVTGHSGRSRSRASVFRVIGLFAAIVVLGWGCLTLWEQKRAADRLGSGAELERRVRQDPAAAMTGLITGLGDPDADVRAASALAMIAAVTTRGADEGPEQIQMAVAALLPSLHDPQPKVRAAATKSVWMVIFVGGSPATKDDLEPLMAPLIERLADADASVRLEAIRGLGSIGAKVSDDIPDALLASLEDESESNRDAAALAVAAYRKGLPVLLPSMAQTLDGRSPQFRRSFVKILEQVQPRRLPPEAIPGFVAALRSRDLDVVRLAVLNISAYDDKGGTAAPELARTLDRMLDVKSPNPGPADRATPELTLAITQCLRLIGHGAAEQKEAVSVLSKALRPDREPALRIAAAKALGRLRPDPALFAALTAYIGDRDPAVRHAVIWAIHDVNFAKGYTVPKALAAALEDPSTETRVDAAAAICHSGMGGDPFVPALVDHALNDPAAEVRSMCANALGMLYGGKITTASIPHLIRGLDGTDHYLRECLCPALARFGRDAAPAIPALIRLLKVPAAKDAWTYKRFAANALGRIAPGTRHADQAVAALIEFLTSDQPAHEKKWVLESTIDALGEFGPTAKGAMPRLRELQQYDNEDVRKAASRALARIQPAG